MKFERNTLMMARELKLITGLVELDRTSLRERALEMLRKAVTAREIEPGSRLVETELSAAMGISRGTLREALRQLEYEGLIEVGDRGRLTVRTLTDAELADMFTVRTMPERMAKKGDLFAPLSRPGGEIREILHFIKHHPLS